MRRSLFLWALYLLPALIPSHLYAGNNSKDIAIIDRALKSAHPTDPWVRFGDVGIKYSDLKAYRDRLAGKESAKTQQSGPTPDTVTPAGTTFKWTGGNVYYRFDPTQVSNGTITETKKQQVRDGVAEWAAFANLHFNEITSVTGVAHYITYQEDSNLGSSGFSSSVGMDPNNAEQFVVLGPNAWNRGGVCHETGHAIGLWHEQQRPDRDNYVVINWNNINAGDQANFAIISDGQTFGTAYDFYSIMHYARKTFSNNGQDSISMQRAYVHYIDVIGNVYDRPLSKIERAGMAAIYGNPSPLPRSRH